MARAGYGASRSCATARRGVPLDSPPIQFACLFHLRGAADRGVDPVCSGAADLLPRDLDERAGRPFRVGWSAHNLYRAALSLLLAAWRVLSRDVPAVVLLFQIALASCAGVLLFTLVRRLVSPLAAFIAAIMYAAYPYLVRQASAYLEITLATTLAIAAVLLLTRIETRRQAAASGFVLGLLC